MKTELSLLTLMAAWFYSLMQTGTDLTITPTASNLLSLAAAIVWWPALVAIVCVLENVRRNNTMFAAIIRWLKGENSRAPWYLVPGPIPGSRYAAPVTDHERRIAAHTHTWQ